MVVARKIRTDSSSSSSIDAKLGCMFIDSAKSSNDAEMSETMGVTVRQALLNAKLEARAIFGLSESINALSKTPEDFLFCFLAAAGTDSSAPANHIHQVLLEAFCFEHDIYIIKVDNAEKLSRMLGTQRVESCALVQKNWSGEGCEDAITNVENRLVDYCEQHWESPMKPVVKLPEK